LEEGDSRATKGRWYAIGADGGFVVGGVLGVLATYNFIKDPLPESSLRTDKPVEFEDPRKSQPIEKEALLRRAPRPALAQRQLLEPGSALPAPKVSVGAVGPDAPGLFIGGKF
jgi:hypothetical protein